MATKKVKQALRSAAADLARSAFEKKGNPKRLPISEEELADVLAVAMTGIADMMIGQIASVAHEAMKATR